MEHPQDGSVQVATMTSPIGHLSVAVRAGRVCALAFADGRGIEEMVRRRFGRVPCEESGDPAGVIGRLRAYFAGHLVALEGIATDLDGTAFQQRVWTALRDIGPGQTRSYRELAQAVGASRATRAVGAANGANPIPLIVPCHRVVSSDGRLGGYGGGLDRKAWLLRHEGSLEAGSATILAPNPAYGPSTDRGVPARVR